MRESSKLATVAVVRRTLQAGWVGPPACLYAFFSGRLGLESENEALCVSHSCCEFRKFAQFSLIIDVKCIFLSPVLDTFSVGTLSTLVEVCFSQRKNQNQV